MNKSEAEPVNGAENDICHDQSRRTSSKSRIE